MAVIQGKVDVGRKAPDVWEGVTDFPRMPEWFYGERKVTMLGSQRGVGAERAVTISSGHTYQERIVRWQEGEGFTFVVLDPPFFIRNWEASVAVSPAHESATLRWEIRYSMRGGVLGRTLDRILVAPVLEKLLSWSLTRFKRLAENGWPSRAAATSDANAINSRPVIGEGSLRRGEVKGDSGT